MSTLDEKLIEILHDIPDRRKRWEVISEIKAAILAELPEERRLANPYAQMGYCLALTDIKNKLQ